jgi:ATP-dependent RNA helicase RhlE
MSFNSLNLSQALVKFLTEKKFTQAYPIQQKAIPEIILGKDILGIAKTGSGKTLSYVLPVLMNIQESSDVKDRHPEVLVLVPTRELAIQVGEVFETFVSAFTQIIKVNTVYGGVSINPQMKNLHGVQILIATPGRLLELIDSNAVHLSKVDTLVLDEADKMLNLGFKEEMNRVFKQLPKKRQNLLFSATLNEEVENVNQLLLKNPIVIKEIDENEVVELINQYAYFVEDDKKGPLLRYLIKSKNMQQVLVFVSSIQRADNVANKLRNNGIEAWPIHSKKSQGARTDLLTKFKHGKLQVLVATDLISRGIDIEFLPFVINYELPRSPKDYIHRIGRTGRAESPGDAISLITPDERHHFKIIQKKLGKRIEVIDSVDYDLKGY